MLDELLYTVFTIHDEIESIELDRQLLQLVYLDDSIKYVILHLVDLVYQVAFEITRK